eukprot:g5509.t1
MASIMRIAVFVTAITSLLLANGTATDVQGSSSKPVLVSAIQTGQFKVVHNKAARTLDIAPEGDAAEAKPEDSVAEDVKDAETTAAEEESIAADKEVQDDVEEQKDKKEKPSPSWFAKMKAHLAKRRKAMKAQMAAVKATAEKMLAEAKNEAAEEKAEGMEKEAAKAAKKAEKANKEAEAEVDEQAKKPGSPNNAKRLKRTDSGEGGIADMSSSSPPEGLPPKKPGWARFVCISDTHGMDGKMDPASIPDGDVLIHAGDFTNTGEKRQVLALSEFFAKLPHEHKIVIAGNHDVTFDPPYYEQKWKRFHRKPYDAAACRAALTNCTYLEGEAAAVTVSSNGSTYKFYGAPWQPEFCDWAFNCDRGPTAIGKHWDKIPAGLDVLVTHGPPLGHGDRCVDGRLVGCDDLLRAVRRTRPRFHVFGHVHEGYGTTHVEWGEEGEAGGAGVAGEGQGKLGTSTTFINASTCTFQYKPTNPPVVF